MKKFIALAAIAVTTSLSAQYSLVAGWDFTDSNPTADPAAYGADLAGSASASLNTNAFQQPSTLGGGGTALDFDAHYVGFGDTGNTPTLGDFDYNNGFSADPFDIYFQGPIDGLAWTISLDVSGLDSLLFQFDSFSTNTAVQTGGVLSFALDGGSSSTSWDTGNSSVTFGSAYAASDEYTLDVSGVSVIDIAFTFASTETAGFALSNRAYFDNIAVGGAVPEPSAYALIGGLLALSFSVARRRRK